MEKDKIMIDQNLVDETMKIAQKLIQAESISPSDGNLHQFISDYLTHLGFEIENIDIEDTKNIYAKIGKGEKVVFAGHTDVVPPGKNWKHPSPYSGIIEEGKLYGRGANDMKTTIACALVAFKYVLSHNGQASLGMLLTSDEEDKAENGIKKIVPILQEKKENIKLFLLGEPTAINYAGDAIKIGRRGSITAVATIYGMQGHIAYPELAKNPIPIALKIGQELQELNFNDEHPNFGATRLQITQINAFNETTNVIPGILEIRFGTRFNILQTQETIHKKITEIFAKHCNNDEYKIEWTFHGNPFICDDHALIERIKNIITSVTKQELIIDAKGATSDGRFLYKLAPVFELGFEEKMAHKVDEHVKIDDIKTMLKIYVELFQQLC